VTDLPDRHDRLGPVLVVDDDPGVRATLVEDLGGLLDGATEVVAVASGEEAVDLARRLAAEDRLPPVAFVERTLPTMSGSALALAFQDDLELRPIRRVLVTSHTSLYEVDAALIRGALHGMLKRPWSTVGLQEQLRAQIATYYMEHDPPALVVFDHLIDDDDRSRAKDRLEERRSAPLVRARDRNHVLLAPHLGTIDTQRRFVAALDRALGHPPRLRIGPGSVLLEQDVDVGGIYVILEGDLELCRTTETGSRVVHRDAAGPIVGLLSLASGQRAFLEVRAVSEVRAIPLTLGQLEQALAIEPTAGALLTRILVDSLAGRLREADLLQLEIDRLAASLEADRDRLVATLDALEQAQADLIAQARMATLGELAAGIAHELNNPVAAIVRTTDHLVADAQALLEGGDPARPVLQRAFDTGPMASADVRAARRALAEQLGDRSLADRMVTAGVTDPASAAKLAKADPAVLDRLVAGNRLGGGLRNLATAAHHIADLVYSLRAYLQGGEAIPFVDDVAVIDTVEDALRLVGHRLRATAIDRHYRSVPPITAQPGRLQEVWTNLVANALDSLEEADPPVAEPRVELTVRPEGDDQVRIEVTDNGPGVPPGVIDQLFEPRFTTKHGRVRFGSGLGLSIVRRVVEDHRGTVTVASEPGRTRFSVVLPVQQPQDSELHGSQAQSSQAEGRSEQEG
jgi:signal transduction histidine kinase